SPQILHYPSACCCLLYSERSLRVLTQITNTLCPYSHLSIATQRLNRIQFVHEPGALECRSNQALGQSYQAPVWGRIINCRMTDVLVIAFLYARSRSSLSLPKILSGADSRNEAESAHDST